MDFYVVYFITFIILLLFHSHIFSPLSSSYTLLLFITFIHGIYNYMPETNHVFRVLMFQLFCSYNLMHM